MRQPVTTTCAVERGKGERSGARSPVARGLGANQSAGLLNRQIWLAGSPAWGWVALDATGRAHERRRDPTGAE
jgi:hypothetical protein